MSVLIKSSYEFWTSGIDRSTVFERLGDVERTLFSTNRLRSKLTEMSILNLETAAGSVGFSWVLGTSTSDSGQSRTLLEVDTIATCLMISLGRFLPGPGQHSAILGRISERAKVLRKEVAEKREKSVSLSWKASILHIAAFSISGSSKEAQKARSETLILIDEIANYLLQQTEIGTVGIYRRDLTGAIQSDAYSSYWFCRALKETLRLKDIYEPDHALGNRSRISTAQELLSQISAVAPAQFFESVSGYDPSSSEGIDFVQAAHWASVIVEQIPYYPYLSHIKRLLDAYVEDEKRSEPWKLVSERLELSLSPPLDAVCTKAELLGRILKLCRTTLGNLSINPGVFELISSYTSWLSYEAEHGRTPTPLKILGQTGTASWLAGATFCSSESSALLEDLLDEGARDALGINSVRKAPGTPALPYPERLKEVVQDCIVSPVLEDRRHNAYYSILLYGPPGSAKTTFAKNLSEELGWPLLVIAQSDFLIEGVDRIELVANRVFRLLKWCKDVVVLFDELEEMILSRAEGAEKDSRLLTSSMLPRIADLRELEKVVFIFATNSLPVDLDPAAIRPGRFDIVRLVDLPSAENLQKFLLGRSAALLPSAPAAAEILKEFAGSHEFAALTTGMSFADLNFYVRWLINAEIAGKVSFPIFVDTLRKRFQDPALDEKLSQYGIQAKRYDRP
ncbi:AAA family ATPase [Tateyamaria armeniaca]|uniref:AAA family ATPase n=1 Tax=Tateyamaria armeniaca TaxID=2518930 RepID=A0ABW8UR85_9RHOB